MARHAEDMKIDDVPSVESDVDAVGSSILTPLRDRGSLR
jgi:hypothetical protein